MRKILPLMLGTIPLLTLAGCAHFGDDMLEITPAVFSECRGVDISVHVAWDASTAVKHGSIKLFVNKPGRQPQLWIEAAPKGSANTPRWASDGWTISLVSEHKVLATRTLESTPCVGATQ